MPTLASLAQNTCTLYTLFFGVFFCFGIYSQIRTYLISNVLTWQGTFVSHAILYLIVSIVLFGLNMVKSGIFGQTAKFRQRPCLFHYSNIGININ